LRSRFWFRTILKSGFDFEGRSSRIVISRSSASPERTNPIPSGPGSAVEADPRAGCRSQMYATPCRQSPKTDRAASSSSMWSRSISSAASFRSLARVPSAVSRSRSCAPSVQFLVGEIRAHCTVACYHTDSFGHWLIPGSRLGPLSVFPPPMRAACLSSEIFVLRYLWRSQQTT
jgi:hypothetical protein